MTTLTEVRAAQPDWFTPENKRFFGDVGYWVLHSVSGHPYLLRSTYAWSDMFGRPRTLSYKVNVIDPDTLEIDNLIDKTFDDRATAKHHIKYYLD